MNIQNNNSANLSALTTAGAVVHPDRNSATPGSRGLTLSSSTTYFIPLDVGDEDLLHVHMRWNAALAAAITVETCDFGGVYRAVDGTEKTDVSDFDNTAGNWMQDNPSGANASAVGTGNSVTALTFTAGGTNAGGGSFHYPNMGARRVRLRVVVTTGGVLRVACNGKRQAVA